MERICCHPQTSGVDPRGGDSDQVPREMEDKGLNLSRKDNLTYFILSKVENSRKLTRSKSMDSIDFNFKLEK